MKCWWDVAFEDIKCEEHGGNILDCPNAFMASISTATTTCEDESLDPFDPVEPYGGK